MKNGRVSSFTSMGALALSLSAPAALAQAGKTGALGAAPAPMPAAARPDLAFKEVQVFYPAFKLGIRLVPPGSAGQTSVLRLIEDPGVAPGTKLGPDQPNGQPGPIATRSCRDPLRSSLRVSVANLGTGPFDATTDTLGLSGNVAGQAVKSAFGKVAAGQTQYVEAGALSLAPGSQAVVLTLNSAHGGGEQNFANNTFETRFQITCDCPQGQVREAATGRCVSPPNQRTPTATPARNPLTGGSGNPPTGECPPGQVRDPVTGRCAPMPPTAAPTPARNPLTGGSGNPRTPTATPTVKPTPVTISPAGGANRGANAGAAPAAMAAAAPRPATPTPRDLVGLTSGGIRVASCFQNGELQHYVGAVNGRTSGVQFTPAGVYRITGCGFGDARGTATLRVQGRDGSTRELDLTPRTWGPMGVELGLAADISGIDDSSNATVIVVGQDNVEARQAGHTFRAARERVLLNRALPAWYTPAGTVYGPGKFIPDPQKAGGNLPNEPYTQAVGVFISEPGQCWAWKQGGYDDRWKVRPTDLRPGFEFVSFEAVDDIAGHPDDDRGSSQIVNIDRFSVRNDGAGTYYVHIHALSKYYKAIAGSSSSDCNFAYHTKIWVQGPRGLPPM